VTDIVTKYKKIQRRVSLSHIFMGKWALSFSFLLSVATAAPSLWSLRFVK
jgi:hypothetical protein